MTAEALPERNKSTAPPGFNSHRLCIIELGPEIPAMEGYGLRLSRVTVEPGAVFAPHSHAGQPEIIHVVEGLLAEQRNDGPWVDHGPGSVLVLTREITHALANRTDRPAVYMSTSVKR
ncbi:MAG TPA: cupin domain-containing protein [Ramlibacter sp.]|nr:cupin domain-containing protein [Ramlibacter sp.]